MGRNPSIVFVSREVWPLFGAGIGRSVWAAARLLADDAEVTILTSERWQGRYQGLHDAEDPRLPAGVKFAFEPEPDGDLSPYLSWHQAWSSRLLLRLAELYPDGGPDLVEVADYGGEGFAMAHARRAGDPRLRNTVLAVRLHTSGEICAKLNDSPEDLELKLLSGTESFPLAFGDVLLEPGGDVLARYGALYGVDSLAPAIHCAPPTAPEPLEAEPAPAPPGHDEPLRILYLNRVERRKGIEELLTAVGSMPSADLTLTVVGGDTDTAPEGASMLEHCRRIAGTDARVEFRDPVPHGEVAALIASHHVVVVPTRWETFSYVTREALAANRPVIATASGAIVDVVEPGRSGWLAKSSAPEDLREALETVLASRAELDEMIQEGLPRARVQDAENGDELRSVYRTLASMSRDSVPPGAESPPGVTAVVAHEAEGPGVTETLRSLREQVGVEVKTVVVTTPGASLHAADLSLTDRLVQCAGEHAGRVAEWIAGAAVATQDLLLLVPSGTELNREFASRAAAALRAAPQLAYATASVQAGWEPWHAPAGNFRMPAEADIGASVALIRAPALAVLREGAPPADESSMFHELARRGQVGVVLQESLVTRLPRRSGVAPAVG